MTVYHNEEVSKMYRLASIGSFRKGSGITKADLVTNGFKCLRYGEIYTKFNISFKIPISTCRELGVTANKGTILFAGDGETKEDIGKTVVYEGIEPISIGGGINILDLKPLFNPKYISYALNSSTANHQKIVSAKGEIIVHIYNKQLKEIRIYIPPLPEQIRIANFLDDKCDKIDKAIAQKERLIELIEERKQIVIQESVTKGLPPAERVKAGLPAKVKMKDSGIEWIGEIPEGWEVHRNTVILEETKEPGVDNLPILSVSIHSGISDRELSDEENIRGLIRIADKSSYKLVRKGDIAYNMMRAWQGGIGASTVDGLVSPAYVVSSPKIKMNSKYFEFLYRTDLFIQQMNRFSKGITDFRKRLYWEQFRNLKTIFPPKSEQDAIVSFIDNFTVKSAILVTNVTAQIKKLKEYKATLIDSVVTGKVRVLEDGKLSKI